MSFISKAELTAMRSIGVAILGDDMDAQQIKVRGLTGSERDELAAAASDGVGAEFLAVRRRLITKCLLDKDGNAMFSSSEELPDLDGAIYSACWPVVAELSGFDGEASEIEGN